MGHTRLHRLPKTRPWTKVVGFILNDCDAAQIAGGVWKASNIALSNVQKDPGFAEVVFLLSQLGVAATKPNPKTHLESVGIRMPDNPSSVDVALALNDAYDAKMDGSGKKSDFGEIAQLSLVSAVTQFLTDAPDDLFPSVKRDVGGAMKGLRKKDSFSDLTRTFFADFTNRFTNYFLSKELADHVGEGRRFATTTQMANFEAAMKVHCDETAAIVHKFSADWFAKHQYSQKKDISRDTAGKFGWYALEKVKSELALRAVE